MRGQSLEKEKVSTWGCAPTGDDLLDAGIPLHVHCPIPAPIFTYVIIH